MSTKTPTVSKIMIIRHAEKPDASDQGVMPDGSQNPEALIVRGWQRSGGLATLFAPARGPLQVAELATPGMVLASWKSATKGSQRPYQTVDALVQKLGLDSAHFVTLDKSDIQGVVDAAIEATGTVLISWQHEDIPSIAEAIATRTGLPVTPTPPSIWPPPSWPGSRFDLVWVFDAVGSGPPTGWAFTQVPQLLLPGDSPTVVTASGS